MPAPMSVNGTAVIIAFSSAENPAHGNNIWRAGIIATCQPDETTSDKFSNFSNPNSV